MPLQPIILHTHHGHRRHVKEDPAPKNMRCLYFLGWFAVEMLRWTASEDLACAVRLVCKILSVSSNDTTWCRRSDFHVMLVGYAMSEHLLREHEHPVQVQHSTSWWYWQPNLLKLRQWFQEKQNPVTACTTNKKILKTELRLPPPRPILKFTYTVSMFVCMQTCFVCPSIYLSVSLSVCPCARLPVCPSARVSVCPSIYLLAMEQKTIGNRGPLMLNHEKVPISPISRISGPNPKTWHGPICACLG